MDTIGDTPDAVLNFFLYSQVAELLEAVVYCPILNLSHTIYKNFLNRLIFSPASLIYRFKTYIYVFLKCLTQSDEDICISLLCVTKMSKSKLQVINDSDAELEARDDAAAKSV